MAKNSLRVIWLSPTTISNAAGCTGVLSRRKIITQSQVKLENRSPSGKTYLSQKQSWLSCRRADISRSNTKKKKKIINIDRTYTVALLVQLWLASIVQNQVWTSCIKYFIFSWKLPKITSWLGWHFEWSFQAWLSKCLQTSGLCCLHEWYFWKDNCEVHPISRWNLKLRIKHASMRIANRPTRQSRRHTGFGEDFLA